MKSPSSPVPRVEPLSIPDGQGALGEIFEAAILHHMRHAARGELNRHFIARALVLVLDVEGEAEYGDETGRVAPLSPGDCFLIDPRIGHRYGPRPGSHWTEMYVCFRGPIFEALEQAAHLMANPVRHLGDPKIWEKRLRCVLPQVGVIEAPDVCIGRLLAFLTEAFPPRLDPASESISWIATAKQMLDLEQVTVAEATDRLSAITGLAPETLRKRFRVVVGHSMKAWQMAGRVATARTLLERGNMTQKEIAATLGFSHPQHFSRCLHKATGSTPGKLAKRTS